MPGTVYDSFAKSQNADGEKLRIHLSDERKSWLGGGGDTRWQATVGSNVVAKSTVSTPQIPGEEAQLVKHRKMHAGILRPLSPLHIHAVL